LEGNAVSGITLALLLMGMYTLAFNILPARASGTIYIRVDGSIDPPSAPISSVDNVTYAFTANISEPIVVQRSNVVMDGKDYAVEGNGTGIGLDLSNTKNITIKNIKISKFTTGIRLYYSPSSTLVNNTITKCVYGILPDASPSITISNNTIAGNYWDGIFLISSENSVLNNNVIAKNGKWGLYLGSSNGIILKNNKMVDNQWNFAVFPRFIQDIDTSNTVDGKPIYYWINQHDRQVPSDAGYVAVINSTNITIRDLNLTKNGQGVALVSSKNCLIENSNITRMGYYAIQLVDSDNNTIRNNNIKDNKLYLGVGISFLRSMGNTITGNIIQNNEKGIIFYSSRVNTIYHNNFVGNNPQVSGDGSKNNWDNGYSFGGNYWSDYNGTDFYSGPYQNVTGNDGIGDTPYVIDASNRDQYPLMNPYVPLLGDLNDDGIVDGKDIAIVAKAFGSCLTHPRWNPLADVNGDSKIEGKDIAIVVKNFGKE